MFIIFDVAAVFIILFGLIYVDLTVAAQFIMLLFVGILTTATLYSLKKEEVYTV